MLRSISEAVEEFEQLCQIGYLSFSRMQEFLGNMGVREGLNT